MDKIKTLIITGFLGAGKTTLINNILDSFENKKIAIIENEFSELGIDSNLIKSSNDNLYELNNGCICCTMNGELQGVLGEIVSNKENFDYLIIETTGVADPAPIVESFFSNPNLVDEFEIDSVITLVDSKHFLKQIDRDFEVKKQIAFGDLIILNKTDLVDQNELILIEKKIKSINLGANLIKTKFSQVENVNFFNLSNFDLQKVEEFEKSINSLSFTNLNSSLMTSTFKLNSHENEIKSIGIEFREEISLPKFDYFIRTLILNKSEDIYRLKGIINIANSNQPIIFQGVHSSIDWHPGKHWESETNRISKLVIIGKNLNKNEIELFLKDLINTPD